MSYEDKLSAFLGKLQDNDLLAALQHLLQWKSRRDIQTSGWVCICSKCCFEVSVGNSTRIWWILSEKGKLMKRSSKYYHNTRGFAAGIAEYFPGCSTFFQPNEVLRSLKAEKERRGVVFTNAGSVQPPNDDDIITNPQNLHVGAISAEQPQSRQNIELSNDFFVGDNDFPLEIGPHGSEDDMSQLLEGLPRYYSADSSSLSFPWHIDNSIGTIIITMPSPAFTIDNNLAIELLDPQFLQDRNFLELVNDKEAFSSHCDSLKQQQTGFFRIQMNVFDVLLMANPVPHRVSPITAGDRISIIIFLE
jgi:hypothetical protein